MIHRGKKRGISDYISPSELLPNHTDCSPPPERAQLVTWQVPASSCLISPATGRAEVECRQPCATTPARPKALPAALLVRSVPGSGRQQPPHTHRSLCKGEGCCTIKTGYAPLSALMSWGRNMGRRGGVKKQDSKIGMETHEDQALEETQYTNFFPPPKSLDNVKVCGFYNFRAFKT